MFGYLRFVLATFVLISHVGIRIFDSNPGVVAVVLFYMLAGYVVSFLFRGIFANDATNLAAFYKDRIKRIFPLYLYAFGVTLIFLLLTEFGDPRYTWQNMLYNTTVIPLNYYMYLDATILQNPPWCAIPQAWSLGAELQIYLLLPLLFLSKRLFLLLLILSLATYTAANTGVLHPDYFGYRLPLGVLFLFLIGSAIEQKSSSDKKMLLLIYLYAVLFYGYCSYTESFSPTYTKETLTGILVGMPLIYALSLVKKRIRYNKPLGDLSYGIFLTHFLGIWILQYLHLYKHNSLSTAFFVFLIALTFSLVGVRFVEKKSYILRK